MENIDLRVLSSLQVCEKGGRKKIFLSFLFCHGGPVQAAAITTTTRILSCSCMISPQTQNALSLQICSYIHR